MHDLATIQRMNAEAVAAAAVDEKHIVVVGYPHQWKGEDVFTFWNLGEAVAFRNEMRRGLPGEEKYRTAEVYKLVV